MLYFGMVPIMLKSALDPLFLKGNDLAIPVVLLDTWNDLCNTTKFNPETQYAEFLRMKLLPVKEEIFTQRYWLSNKNSDTFVN